MFIRRNKKERKKEKNSKIVIYERMMIMTKLRMRTKHAQEKKIIIKIDNTEYYNIDKHRLRNLIMCY